MTSFQARKCPSLARNMGAMKIFWIKIIISIFIFKILVRFKIRNIKLTRNLLRQSRFARTR